MNIYREVAVFMELFFQLFSPALLEDEEKFSHLITHYSTPLIFQDSETVYVLNADEIRQKLRDGLSANAAKGWVSSESSHMDVFILNPGQAVVTRAYSRLKADDSVLENGAATYVLNKNSGSWKISMAFYHGAGDRLVNPLTVTDFKSLLRDR